MNSGSDDFSDDNKKEFKFEIVNGEVVAVFELKDGELDPKSIDDDGSETYTVLGNEVVRTEQKLFGSEITHYADSDGDGLYTRVSEQWQRSSDAPDDSSVHQLPNILSYFPTDDDDFIAVRGGDDSFGGLGADSFVIREASHLHIDDFHSSEGDNLIFDTGLGLNSKEHLASFITDVRHDGQSLIVDFNSDVSITFAGVQPVQIGWGNVSVLS